MKLKFRILKIIVLLIAFIFLLNFTIQKNDKRALLKFNIDIKDSIDKKFVTNKTIINVISNLSNRYPTKIEDLQIQKIEKKLKKNPFVDTVNVSLDINGKLMVYLEQKTPILRVNNKKEQFYLTNDNQFLPISPNYSYKCMLIDGNIQKEDREALIGMVYVINEDELLKNHIIGIKKIKPKSFNLLVNYGNYIIEFGELENYKQKLENLKEFYKQYLNKVPEGTYHTISLKYNNQIVGIKNKANE